MNAYCVCHACGHEFYTDHKSAFEANCPECNAPHNDEFGFDNEDTEPE